MIIGINISSLLFHHRGVIILLCFLQLSYKVSYSQEKIQEIVYGFKQDTLHIRSGETFSNSFYIVNNKKSQVILKQSDYSFKRNKGLLKLPDTIKLQAGEKKWYPLKYIADQETIQEKLQDISVQLQQIDFPESLPAAQFYAKLENAQYLFIDSDQQELYLNDHSGLKTVMVRFFNNGLVSLRFKVELIGVPEGLSFVGDFANIILKAGEQLTRPYSIKNNGRQKSNADFSVSVRAVDESGAELAAKRLRIMSVSSDRVLALNQTSFYQNRPNTVALRYMLVDKSFSSYQLHGNGAYEWANHEYLSYQLNADYINNPSQKGMNLTNSYIHYNNRAWGIKAGNIYEPLDFSVNGRGVKITGHLDAKRTLNAYYLDNNNFLYSEFNKIKMGSTFALSFNEEGEYNKHIKSFVLLRNIDSWTGVNTTLTSLSFLVPLGKYQQIGFDAGLSKQDINGVGSKDYVGRALGFSYSLNFDRVKLNSVNYYSSPYYGGLRRGVFQLDNSISIVVDKNSEVNIRIDLARNEPKFLTNVNGLNLPLFNGYGQSTYEFGYNRRLDKWNLAITPYYFYQYLHINSPSSLHEKWLSSSLRTKLNTRYIHGNHQFSLESDNGYTFRSSSSAPFWSSRMNFNYRNPILGFTAYSQFNSYYLTDAIGISQDPQYSVYSFGPNTHFSFFERRISINANALYNYYGYNRTKNYVFNGNIRWLLNGQWTISGDFYYGFNQRSVLKPYDPLVGVESQEFRPDELRAFRFNNTQIRVGIEKSFGRNGNSQNKNLEMIYFDDKNANQQREDNEPLISGIMVKVDGLAAITNAQGRVRFLAAKNKSYQVSIVSSNGWSLARPLEVFLNKNQKLDIPLVRKEKLSGILKYMAEKYKGESPKLGGIRVKAIADNGIVFETITDEEGQFHFYLPQNRYTVFIDTDGMHFSIPNGKRVVEVKLNSTPKIIFDYKDEQKKIDVTHF